MITATLLTNSNLCGKFWGKLCRENMIWTWFFKRSAMAFTFKLNTSASVILYTITSTLCVKYEPDSRQRRENIWPSVWYWPFLCEFSVTTAVVEPGHSPEPRTDSPSTSQCTHPPTCLVMKVLQIIVESSR